MMEKMRDKMMETENHIKEAMSCMMELKDMMGGDKEKEKKEEMIDMDKKSKGGVIMMEIGKRFKDKKGIFEKK